MQDIQCDADSSCEWDSGGFCNKKAITVVIERERRSRAKSGHVYSLSNTDDLAKWNVGLVQDFSEMFAWIPCGSKCATNLPQIKTDPR